MASTISINFATVEEVFDSTTDILGNTVSLAPQKKSVSARVLAEALGGGKVGGGYVQRTGGLISQMTGFLYLTGTMPIEPYHAVPKKYVDDHSYTRRYHFVCRSGTSPGYLQAGTTVVSGFDLNTNPFFFFDRSDVSREAIPQYVDVYRDGILQKFGSNDDYEIVNTSTFFGGTTAIIFKEPFVEGTTVQVNIGNVGALPLTFGVSTISAGYGMETSMFSGDISLFVTPSSFAASSLEVSLSTIDDKFVSPKTLSAYPLMPRALGLFRKQPGYYPGGYPTDRFGGVDGNFDSIKSFKITGVISDPDRISLPIDLKRFRVIIEQGTLTTTDYNASININVDDTADPNLLVGSSVIAATRTLTSFDFFIADPFGDPPSDVYEISILVY